MSVNRRAIIIGILIVLLFTLIAGGAALFFLLRSADLLSEASPPPPPSSSDEAPPPTLPSPEEVAAHMAAVEGQVGDLRGLESTNEVVKDFMTEAELRQEIEADFAEDYPPQEATDDALVLAAFNFISPDLDLYALYIDLYAEQIAGFYDTEEKEFFLISSQAALTGFNRLIFAHEYTHALQDQNFDLESYDLDGLDDQNPDAALALLSLIEGDAELLTEQYLATYFTRDDLLGLFTELDGIDTTVYDSAPPIIQRDLAFPYLEGKRFVQALYEEGGWRYVDIAYAGPPQSTEQILHPDRYLDGDLPQTVELPSALDALGGGWRLVDESTLGEFHLLVYLEEHLDSPDAVPAAEGWGGDRYAVYHHQRSDQTVLVLRLAWDSPGQADEFLAAYRLFGAARAGRQPTTDRGAVTCWTARDYLCVAGEDSHTWVLLGPNRATLRDVLTLYGIED